MDNHVVRADTQGVDFCWLLLLWNADFGQFYIKWLQGYKRTVTPPPHNCFEFCDFWIFPPRVPTTNSIFRVDMECRGAGRATWCQDKAPHNGNPLAPLRENDIQHWDRNYVFQLFFHQLTSHENQLLSLRESADPFLSTWRPASKETKRKCNANNAMWTMQREQRKQRDHGVHGFMGFRVSRGSGFMGFRESHMI